MSFAAMMLIGLGLDAVLGWPGWLFARIGHPVTWIGYVITKCDHMLNTGPRRWRLVKGGLVCGGLVLALGAGLLLVQRALPEGWLGIVLGGVLAWPWIAARSMYTHVADVARPLAAGDLEAARRAVAMIVGRDPAQLDGAGVARASLESLAENTSDGIIAPLFWGAVAGLPGIGIYKCINTLDSMIGHRTPRHEAFGKASARLDDLVNLIPARLSGALFAVVSGRGRAWRAMLRDARAHRSPNAGWPEAALAGALGVRLSGPRVYGDRRSEEPWLNGTAPDPTPGDLWRGLALYLRAVALMGAGLLVIALF